MKRGFLAATAGRKRRRKASRRMSQGMGLGVPRGGTLSPRGWDVGVKGSKVAVKAPESRQEAEWKRGKAFICGNYGQFGSKKRLPTLRTFAYTP